MFAATWIHHCSYYLLTLFAATTTISCCASFILLPPTCCRGVTTARPASEIMLPSLTLSNNSNDIINQRAEEMSSRAKNNTPLTEEEVQDVMTSFRNITPVTYEIDWTALELLVREVTHLSHKDWDVTGWNSERLSNILLPNDNTNVDSTAETRLIFDRILHEGNWDGAKSHAVTTMMNKLAVVKRGGGGGEDNEGEEEVSIKEEATKEEEQEQNSSNISPWAVLVTGVNGIRKTTSIYQPWFKDVLAEALVEPASASTTTNSLHKVTKEQLPTGQNSFFRQLDHIIATLCNVEFATLYALTGAQMSNDNHHDDTLISKELMTQYSNLKAAIFMRYRTLSELVGVLLLRNAQSYGMNIMCETSGRDVAMFTYIDTFFSSSSSSTCSSGTATADNVRYNKLAIHFTINNLSYAKTSVDTRMINEMKVGTLALTTGQVKDVIYANMGGPYGSEVLSSVQLDSNRVWNDVILKNNGVSVDGEGGVGSDWYKATMQINAYSNKSWTIQAVQPDGSLGTEYTFEEPRVVIK